MFKRTRLKLVVLNSVVFFVLINLFSLTLYLFMQHRLFGQIDHTLKESQNHLIREYKNNNSLLNNVKEEDKDENRLIYILRGNDNEVTQNFGGHLPQAFIKSKVQQGLYTYSMQDDRNFRVLAFSFNKKVIIDGNGVQIKKIQLLYNMGHEHNMLRNLLLLLIFGGIISVVISIVVGNFLASRALIPIQLAWDKHQQFVANASHELRTPLSVMKLNLEQLFRHPDRTIEEESVTISEAIYDTKYMSKMVESLLVLARSDSNQLEINQDEIHLDHILNKLMDYYKELADLKDIQLESSIESPLILIGDIERLQQLFIILFDNAMKFTHDYGKIMIKGYRRANTCYVEVSDTGIGVSEEDLPQIFDRFYRGDKSRNRKYEGTGLGLSIAKWIVEAHGGEISVKSTLHQGSNFTVSLPMQRRKIK